MEVVINNRTKQLNPSMIIGQGGEADVFDLGDGTVAKIFKQPSHPDFASDKNAKAGAKLRLKEMQLKLPAFPKNLPPQVIAPLSIITNKGKKNIVGYVMPFVKDGTVLYKYTDKKFRQSVDDDDVAGILRNIHRSVSFVHDKSVVLGDFNDLNILVAPNGDSFLIDADSFQFGKFPCRLYTSRFVDPLLCDPNAQNIHLTKAHGVNSDWYAFCVMVFQCFLFVGPYGGVYKPKDKNKKIKHDLRPLHRVTVFNDEVKYPKPARPYSFFSDDLLQHMHLVFEKDQRIEFPMQLLEGVAWKRLDHTLPPAAITAVITMRGTVTATREFKTSGLIVKAAMQDGKIKYLYNEDRTYYREGKKKVCSGPLEKNIRFGICGERTLIGKDDRVICLRDGKSETLYTSQFENVPSFDSNGKSVFWIQDGDLRKEGEFGSSFVGSVLKRRTMFWVGEKLGFGFYQAGEVNVGFVFDPKFKGINDSVELPRITGKLIDGSCFFTSRLAWFFYTVQEQMKTINYCRVIDSAGKLIASASVEKGTDSWMGRIKGKFPAGNFILSATDEGMIRAEVQGNQVVETKKFPDTEPFVSSETRLFPATNGVFVVNSKEIYLLKIS